MKKRNIKNFKAELFGVLKLVRRLDLVCAEDLPPEKERAVWGKALPRLFRYERQAVQMMCEAGFCKSAKGISYDETQLVTKGLGLQGFSHLFVAIHEQDDSTWCKATRPTPSRRL